MADSQITASGLTIAGGFGQVVLSYETDDPHEDGLLNLSLDVMEIWSATSNDRAHASFAKVAEGSKELAIHAGLARGATNYYWIRPRSRAVGTDGERFYGDWYPLGATDGVLGTELIGSLTVPAVGSFVVSGGIGMNSMTWVLTDPNANGLGDLALDVVEIHASATNDRSAATKVAEGKTFTIHNGLAAGTARYYWARPRHINGTFGAWLPVSSTGGSMATELSGDISTSATGYWVLPSGLVFEWGTATANGSGIATATMQKINSGVFSEAAIPSVNPASTEAYSIHLQSVSLNSPNPGWNLIYEATKTTTGGTVAAAAGLVMQWFAIGYKT